MHYIRNTILISFLGLFFILIQGSIFKSILPAMLVPNLVISLVVFLAFYENSPFGALLSFLLGLQIDFYSGQLLLVGPTAGAYVARFGLIASLSQRIFVDSGLAVFIVTVMAGVASTLIYTVLVYEFNKAGVGLIPVSLVSSLVTAIFTPALFRFLRVLYFGRSGSLGARSRGVAV